jgi:hypothetical protein
VKPEVALDAGAQVREIYPSHAASVARLDPDQNVTKTLSEPRRFRHPAVGHRHDLAGQLDMCRLLPKVEAGLPLDPLVLVLVLGGLDRTDKPMELCGLEQGP